LTTGHGQAQNRGMSTLPMRLLLVVVFSGHFLALTVAARGGIGAFFSQPALIGLTVVLIRAMRSGARRRWQLESRRPRGHL
jgi:hypothetical protein